MQIQAASLKSNISRANDKSLRSPSAGVCMYEAQGRPGSTATHEEPVSRVYGGLPAREETAGGPHMTIQRPGEKLTPPPPRGPRADQPGLTWKFSAMRSGVTDLGITIRFLCMGNRISTCAKRCQARTSIRSSALSTRPT